VDCGEQLGQALADPPVGALGRLAEEPLQVADFVPYWRDHLHLRDCRPHEEPQFNCVRLGDDADVVDDRVPQLPDEQGRLA
jgi:hypothetical protein